MANLTANLIHKQVYPATETFKDVEDGAFPDSWTDDSGVDTATTIIALFQSHRKVLQMVDNSGANTAGATVLMTQGINTTIEFWVAKSSVAANTDLEIRIFEDATRIIRILFPADDMNYVSAGTHSIKANFMIADTFVHIKIVLDDSADTMDVYIDGVLEGADLGFENGSTSGMTSFQLITNGADTGYTCYVDAVGFSVDPSYNIGDNIQWRHLKESADVFEGDDIGDQGTDMTWVDNVDVEISSELVQVFNAHKKIIRIYSSTGGGTEDYAQHNFPTSSKNGWFSCWLKTADKTIDNYIMLRDGSGRIIQFGIGNSVFEYEANGGAWTTVPSSPTPVDDIWYLIYIRWYDAGTDNWDLWIDNVQYLNGVDTFNNQDASGIDRVRFVSFGAVIADALFADAPISSLDGDEIGDNRTFDYKAQSYDDITSSLSKAEVEDEAYLASTATIEASLDVLTISGLHILQLYDVNSDLRFEGNFFKKTQNSGMDLFTFHSLNKSNLKKLSSYTASAEDPSEILLGIFTDVAQNDGDDVRLLYYEEDDPAGSHSPTIIRTPNVEIIRRMAYHADRYAIIKPNGILTLDADRDPSNGAETITASTGEIRGDPTIESFDSQINKVTVFGDFDLDTGIQFQGISQDTTAQGDGTLVNEYSKTYKDLRSDADCLARATAIRTGTGFKPSVVTTELLNVYANIGEVINLAYGPKSFSATDCYAKKATHNLISGISLYELSTGIFEDWGMSQEQWSIATEGERQNIDGIYSTDLINMPVALHPGSGATETDGYVILDANNEQANAYFYLDPNIDDSRDMIITWTARRADVNGGNITVDKVFYSSETDGSDFLAANAYSDLLDEWVAPTNLKIYKLVWTIPAAELVAGRQVWLLLNYQEAGDTMQIFGCNARYYMKRTV